MLMDIEPAEPRKTGHNALDLVLAGAAVFLSLVSLGVAILHGHTMERMAEANAQLVQANSWPFLQAYTSNQGDQGSEIRLTLVNNGVGPAKIFEARILYKGTPVQRWDTLLSDCCSVPGEAPLNYGSNAAGPMVLRAGDSITLLSVPQPEGGSKAWDVLNRERREVTYDICYCSVFDDCWITDARTLRPRPVATCPGSGTTEQASREH